MSNLSIVFIAPIIFFVCKFSQKRWTYCSPCFFLLFAVPHHQKQLHIHPPLFLPSSLQLTTHIEPLKHDFPIYRYIPSQETSPPTSQSTNRHGQEKAQYQVSTHHATNTLIPKIPITHAHLPNHTSHLHPQSTVHSPHLIGERKNDKKKINNTSP